MRHLKTIAVLLFLVILLSCNKEIIDPVPIDSDSKILFLSAREGNTMRLFLVSMNIDGTEQTQISDLSVIYEKPAISHSKTKIAFAHLTEDQHFELYTLNTDGTNISLIESNSNYCGSPAWSKDDSKIIYLIQRNELTIEKDIILYDINLKKKDTLTFSGNNRLPQFLNEEQIIFCNQIDEQPNNIYRMNLDGSDKQMIIPEACCAAISPNGNEIAYISYGEQGSSQIYTSNADGTNLQQLTDTFLPSWDTGFPPFGNYEPHWTPDGEKIVYTSEINDGLPEIYIMDSNGSNQTRLTNTERRNQHPEVTSDGTSILFASNRDMSLDAEILLMDLNGENQIHLSNYPGQDIFPIEIK